MRMVETGMCCAGEFGDQIVVVVILAVGVAVGEQNHLAHRDAALQNLAFRDFERVLEVGAAAGLQAVDAIFQLAAILAQRLQMREHVRLRIERDHAGEIGVVELAQQRDRGLLGVANSLAVAHRRIARVVTHRVRAIDAEVNGDRLARRRRRLRHELHRQRLFQLAAGQASPRATCRRSRPVRRRSRRRSD